MVRTTMTIAPILLDLPEQFESERLIIRCPRPGDGQTIYEATIESLADLRRFPASMSWAMNAPSLESSETFCREGYANYQARKDLPLLLFLKSNGALVGASGLHRFNWKVPKFEIGFWCRSSLQGNGFITEAVNAITAIAFELLGAHRVVVYSDELNIPSWRVCERAGYELEGTMRNDRVDPDGTLRNIRVYAKTR